jgi:opacity protein-like surface antigen
MKKLLLAAFLAITPMISQAVILGVSAGYLTDAKEEYIAARFGTEFRSNTSLAHIGEFEVGYTSQNEGGIKASFMPVTVNYRAQFAGSGPFGGYVGVGAGMALTKVSFFIEHLAMTKSYGYEVSEQNWSFTTQVFAGATYKFAPTSYLTLGARYIWIDDVKLFGTRADVGDDTVLEAGLHFRF